MHETIGHAAPAARRVLLLPLGTWGDVLPYVRLGCELQRRGHAVTLAAGEIFEPLARRSGLAFVSSMDRARYEAIVGHKRLWHPRWASITFLREAVLPSMRSQFEIVRHAQRQSGCDVLVAPAQSLGARIARDEFKIPLATVHLAPYMFRSALHSRRVSGAALPEWLPPICRRPIFRLADLCGDVSFGRAVNQFLRERQLRPAKRIFWQWWNSPDRILGLFPEWFAAPQADWPSQTVLTGFLPSLAEESAPLGNEVQTFLTNGSRPIVFTMGTAMAHGASFFAAALEAVRRLSARAIFLTQYRNQLPPNLPSEILAPGFVPLEPLLQQAAAVVHHAGIGTSSQALALGVPQVSVPMSFDQPDNAYRLQQLGVGQTLRWQNLSASALVPLLRRALGNESLRQRCQEVASWCETAGGLENACDEIELLAGVTPRALTAAVRQRPPQPR